MQQKAISIRQRFVGIVLVLVIMMMAVVVYESNNAELTLKKQQDLFNQQNELGEKLLLLSDKLQELVLTIYQKSFISDHLEHDEIEQQIEQVVKISKGIVEQNNPIFREQIDTLNATLEVLFGQINTLLTVQKDVEKRYPAMPIMLDELQPTNVEFMSAVVEALNDSPVNPKSSEVTDILLSIRYSWAQLISSVRVFVANRLGAFGPPGPSMEVTQNNRNLYAAAVKKNLQRLQQLSEQGKLGLIQENAVENMAKMFARYEKYFPVVAEIYYSNTWRADHSLMRDGIDPLLNTATGIIAEMRSKLTNNVAEGVNDVEAVTQSLTESLWFIGGLITLFIIAGYTSFEAFIRKPLRSISMALVAEGEGKKFKPKYRYRIRETEQLIDALANMRQQVRSRQLRLQSILDNAGEGIFTVDRFGRIETFNQAAEVLFGTTEEEVINQNISKLIPEFHLIKHKDEVLSNKLLKKRKLLNIEKETMGLTRNGDAFPISIRLGKVILEGEIIYVALVSDISERKDMVDRLKELAERDSLTGLYNRHFFMDELDRLIERSQRKSHIKAALLYFDLDNFKYVNDTMGHLAGDHTLRETAKVLTNRVRASDLVVRLGGDEFAIILYESDLQQAQYAADAYRRQLSEHVFQYDGKMLDIGCSVGVAMFEQNIATKEELLVRADLACHIAKRAGRNRVYFFQEKDKQNTDAMSMDMGWARRIKNSIENNLFVTNCQPIMNMKTGKITSYEILIRMRDDCGELIMPSGFLPSAERFGLMQDIDKWVIKHSMRNIIGKKNSHRARYAINLSAKSIGDDEILALIEAELDRSAVNPNNIVFEVTENSAIHNVNNAVEFLTKLKKLGFKTALDDFGVGYSSFSYLKDFPVDYVKIDKSFVQNLVNDKVKKAIVSSMNDIAHALGKETVAEYVEDKETVDFLGSIGVDFCQGYYIGQPNMEPKISKDNIVYLS